jgi:hypothetical protein
VIASLYIHTYDYTHTHTHTGEALRISMDPSGMFFAVSTSDRHVRLFDWFSGQCVAKVCVCVCVFV